jgi:hypothetical protein
MAGGDGETKRKREVEEGEEEHGRKKQKINEEELDLLKL